MMTSKNHSSEFSIYEITKRALFTEFIMNEDESKGTIICEKCMLMWENYYEYLSKHFENVILNFKLKKNPHNHV